MHSLPAKMEILLILAKNSLKTENNFFHGALFHMKTTVSLKYFVNDYGYCLYILLISLGTLMLLLHC